MKEIRKLVSLYRDQIIEYRRWLHQNPELSGKEEKTASYIAGVLRTIGVEPREHIGGLGVVAVIHGCQPGKCVALRADFDALPVLETTGLEYKSVTPGVSHACGHDFHAAMLLGAAHILQDMRGQFKGEVKLIFQPSEEDNMASGAKKMIENGVLENPHVDAIFGQHVWPQCPVGTISLRKGAMMAASDRFYITVKGKKSHGSEPENGVDAIVIAGQVISALQTIVSRNISPTESAVITIGQICGGDRYNIIADEVSMVGTCRNLNSQIRDSMPDRIKNILQGVTAAMGGEYEFEYLKGYSPVVNDPELFDLAEKIAASVVGESRVENPPYAALGGEDFSYYCEHVPGCFYWLGCHDTAKEFYALHHGSFSPEECSLEIGTELLATAAISYLKG